MTGMAGGRRRTVRSSQTKEAILKAAGIVFAENGYEATSLEAIAAEAGVTKATVYYHFDSKEAIYGAVLTRYLVEALETVQAHIKRGGSATDILCRILQSQLDDTLDPAKRYISYQEIVRAHPETRRTVRECQRRYEDAVASIIQRGQDSGEFLEGDARILTFLLVGAIGRTSRWFRPGGRISVAEFRQTVLRLLLGGLLKGKNHDQIAQIVLRTERDYPWA